MTFLQKTTCLISLLTASALAAVQPVAIYDWQFNEPAGTSVFVDVENAGNGTANFGDWQTYTTDGSGNWRVGDSTGQANKFSSIYMFYEQGVSTNGVWQVNIRVKAWEFANSPTDSSQLIFGFIDSAAGQHQVKMTSNANAIKLTDNTTLVANFKAGSESSANFTADGIPNDGGGTPIAGAPALAAGSVLNLRYTVDLDAGTYDYSYAVNDGTFFSVASGIYSNDVQKFRLATQNMEAEDFFLLDYITVTGTGDFPVKPASPWADYPLVNGAARDTGIGWIYDDQYPFVYHYNAATWMYMVPEATTLDSVWGYNYAGGYWFWTANTYGGWYFNFTDPGSGNQGWSNWMN